MIHDVLNFHDGNPCFTNELPEPFQDDIKQAPKFGGNDHFVTATANLKWWERLFVTVNISIRKNNAITVFH